MASPRVRTDYISYNINVYVPFTTIDFRGFTDFAGSAVVHLAGAVLSLPGCVILGARFNKGSQIPPDPHFFEH